MSKIMSEELRKLIEAATPGPWRYEKGNGSPTTGMHMIAGGRPGYLAEVRDCGSGGVAANALLISHLPDLAAEVLELREREAKMVEALRFYANPVIYEPHPHGPAFDRRDVSFKARAVLTEWEAHNG